MSLPRTWSCLAIAVLALALPTAAWAQQPDPDEDYSESEQEEQQPPPARPGDAPVMPPDSGAVRTEPQSPLTPGEGVAPIGAQAGQGTLTPPAPEKYQGVLLDGRPRQGPFLSGPGSLTFILHNTILGAAGGFFTQAFAHDYSFDKSSRESMLAGTLIGAGLGFAASAWWQFNHWVDTPMANFSIANAVVGGMFAAGFMDLIADDAGLLTWSTFIGAELGTWLTAYIGGGQMPFSDGLLVASGAGWSLIYTTLLLAIVNFSGTKVSGATWKDALLIAPGVGAGALALATMRYNPTSAQILRANIFGAGVGAAVLLISALVLGGFDQPTPYVLSFLGSAGAIATVSLLWQEGVEPPPAPGKVKAYKNVWW
ncbi:hypothetical protein P2318_18540 [Myxococcaceae bacterium GXIMD 01537]